MPDINQIKNDLSYSFQKPAVEKFKSKNLDHVKLETVEDRAIKAEIERLKQWENHVKQHELNHAIVGGSHVGGISYVYTYGPDGKKYISGGQVSVSIPSGINHESIAEIKKLKKATGASHDMSMKDSIAAAILGAVERTRTQHLNRTTVVDKYEESLRQKAELDLKHNREIFVFKKMNFPNKKIFELFV